MSEEIDISKIMIASTGSGKGKTTFTTALLEVLKDKGVHAFKCGPDYIDPMFHENVLRIPSCNLDPFFCDEKLLCEVYEENRGSVNVIEAAMGLYDGIGATSQASAYEVASALSCPIILLIDGHGMGYSIVAEIKGFLSMDRNNLIKGVVLNRVSEKYYGKIARVIEEETGIHAFGYIPSMKSVSLKSRHLGLMSPEENEFKEKLEVFCKQIKESVDIDGMINLSNTDSTLDTASTSAVNTQGEFVIAVAKDEAFSFIYEENIKVLERLGGRVVYFSPVHDSEIPSDARAIVLYGGYPENYAKELSDNKSMIESIRSANINGVKIIAECGGFMYLLDSLNVDENDYKMTGIIPGKSYRTKSLVRFGYVNVLKKDTDADYYIAAKAHEFHHFEAEGVCYSDDMLIENEASKDRYHGMVVTENIMAGFPHLYYRGNERLIREFLFL